MTPALALSALLWLPAAQGRPAEVPAFQPHFLIRLQPADSRLIRRDADREIVCGMVVIHKTAAEDPKILLPARDAGAAVRRIEPQGCGATAIVTAK